MEVIEAPVVEENHNKKEEENNKENVDNIVDKDAIQV